MYALQCLTFYYRSTYCFIIVSLTMIAEQLSKCLFISNKLSRELNKMMSIVYILNHSGLYTNTVLIVVFS